jgi:hypothetical protein
MDDPINNPIDNELENWIQTLKNSGDLLHHRLDSIERLLEHETFNSKKLFLKPKTENASQLLIDLGFTETHPTLEELLKKLNKWLINSELVDLNDLQILITPQIEATFEKTRGLQKAPYPLLLASLPQLFNI